jgi:hypothetical protein
VSESAWLVDDTARVKLGLGKPVRHQDGSVSHFDDGSRNSANPELTRALWKFIADNANHSFRVVSGYSDDFAKVSEYRTIGSDAIGDIDFPEYLDGWPG